MQMRLLGYQRTPWNLEAYLENCHFCVQRILQPSVNRRRYWAPWKGNPSLVDLAKDMKGYQNNKKTRPFKKKTIWLDIEQDLWSSWYFTLSRMVSPNSSWTEKRQLWVDPLLQGLGCRDPRYCWMPAPQSHEDQRGKFCLRSQRIGRVVVHIGKHLGHPTSHKCMKQCPKDRE